jgi:hypothetical protein
MEPPKGVTLKTPLLCPRMHSSGLYRVRHPLRGFRYGWGSYPGFRRAAPAPGDTAPPPASRADAHIFMGTPFYTPRAYLFAIRLREGHFSVSSALLLPPRHPEPRIKRSSICPEFVCQFCRIASFHRLSSSPPATLQNHPQVPIRSMDKQFRDRLVGRHRAWERPLLSRLTRRPVPSQRGEDGLPGGGARQKTTRPPFAKGLRILR